MSLDELDQALLEAKWGDAEADVIEIIARMLEISRGAVERVIYAFDNASGNVSKKYYNRAPTLTEQLKTAVDYNMSAGLARMTVRAAIEDGTMLLVHPHTLIKEPTRICAGCSFSIDCIARTLSTPRDCYRLGPPTAIIERESGPQLSRYRRGCVPVTPQKITGNTVTVTCAHPTGTFLVNAEELMT